MPNGQKISKDNLVLTFKSHKELLKTYPTAQKGNAHFLGEIVGKFHVNFSVSDYEETLNNIRGLGVHEIYGHGILKIGLENHYEAYWASINSQYWTGTTEQYKRNAASGMWSSWTSAGNYSRMPEKYMKIVDKYYE